MFNIPEESSEKESSLRSQDAFNSQNSSPFTLVCEHKNGASESIGF